MERLHKETDRLRHRLNPMPDLITFASNDVVDRLQRYINIKTAKVNPDTIYASLQIDAKDGEVERNYANFYVDTKSDTNAGYTNLDDISDYIDTKVVYLSINPAPNDQSSPSYRRFRRQR